MKYHVSPLVIGGRTRGIFINHDDAIFVAAHQKNEILLWSNGSISPVRRITVELFEYTTLFVMMNGDIYFENRKRKGQIDKLSVSATNSILVTTFSDSCYGLFVDSCNTLYCSIKEKHRVVKISLDNTTTTEIIVAGTGSKGSAPRQLDQPFGIFVNTNFDLYVADAINHRIQLFRQGERNGTTVAGKGIPPDLCLNYPTDIVLDANGLLFIADNENYRVIRVQYNRFHCVIDCSGKGGAASNQWSTSYSIRFDSHANLYVADEKNNRVQKFILARNSCETVVTTMSTPDCTTTSSSFRQTVQLETIATTMSTLDSTIVSSSFGQTTQLGRITTTYANQPLTTYTGQPKTTHADQPTTIYTDQPTTTYASQPATTYAGQPTTKYVSQSTTTYASQPTTTYAGQPKTTYADQPTTIYASQPTTKYVSQSTTNYASQPPTTYTGRPTTTYGSQPTTHANQTTTNYASQPTATDQSQPPTTYAGQPKTHANQTTTTNRSQSPTTYVGQTTTYTSQPTTSYADQHSCSNALGIGPSCNISNAVCDMVKPCHTGSICNYTNENSRGYLCLCPPGFNGSQCQVDNRSCKPNTCWNNGICVNRTNNTFFCQCDSGWEGDHCERKTNYCQNVTCENRGVCRPLHMNYICECLGNNYYYGRHCEIKTKQIIILNIVSKSFGYVGYLVIISFAMFIVIMDILKYCFGIDSTQKELERIRRKKLAEKRKPVIQRFIYVNAPITSEQPNQTVAETAV